MKINKFIQAAKTDSPDPAVPLAMAFRSLSDDSRSLALASRYEARLQRIYDRAYKTLRELQQIRKSQEPTRPQNIQIRWVNPSVSEGAEAEDLPKEPTVAAEPRASASGPAPAPNEPTGAEIEEFTDQPTSPEPQPFAPPFRNANSPGNTEPVEKL
jgi:hypothetical protein